MSFRLILRFSNGSFSKTDFKSELISSSASKSFSMQSSTVSINGNLVFSHLENAEPFNDIRFFEYFEEIKDRLEVADTEKLDELVEKMNRFLIICNEGSNGTPFWIYEDRSIDEEVVRDWFPVSIQKLSSLFAKYKFEMKSLFPDGKRERTEKTNVFNYWKTHRAQRLVNSITFHPQLPSGFLLREDKNEGTKIIFNRWTGFSPGDIDT